MIVNQYSPAGGGQKINQNNQIINQIINIYQLEEVVELGFPIIDGVNHPLHSWQLDIKRIEFSSN